jgi:uncharacterized LabA/DUF88 family protein
LGQPKEPLFFQDASMIRIAIMIDGGYLRAIASHAGKTYNPDFIEKFSLNCRVTDEEILRVLYYDCAFYEGKQKLPVSGTLHQFTANNQWLTDLSRKNLFAVRRGILKFRGFKPIKIPIAGGGALQDSDFKPDFEQKGVDMRIGLDIANYSSNKAVDRIVLVSNDTDCIPALKHGRKSGLQIVVIELPGCHTAPELLSHSDFLRAVAWP